MAQNLGLEDQWRLLMEEGKMTPERLRVTQFYALLPASSRCRVCKLPMSGFAGQIMHALGRSASNINPHLCNFCESFFRSNPGGIEIRLSMLFADIRGSTSLAEHMKPTEFKHLISRFFAAATDILAQHDAIIDKLAGDQVSGYFVPGLAGKDHARVAVEAANQMLQASGYGSPEGPWIPVGIGVNTGNAFIGSVGKLGGIYDFTALGDSVNVTARLASHAGPGEILMSQETYESANQDFGALKSHEMELKGRTQPVSVYVMNAQEERQF